MWRTLSKRVSFWKIKFSASPNLFAEEAQTINSYSSPSFRPLGTFSNSWCAKPRSTSLSGFSNGARAYGTAAEAISSEEYSSGSDDLHELVERMNRESQLQPKKMIDGIEIEKYLALKRKQAKLETEAWESAAKEYQELTKTMCDKKLAPNLPFMKSLFLGWFEPLRDAIEKDQQKCEEALHKPNYAPYIHYLNAAKLAVITMHQIMALMMTNAGGTGSCRVVQASSHLGRAIEHEVRIIRFLENNTKKKKENDTGAVEINEDRKKLRKKVTKLINKHKVHKVRALVKVHDDSEPWAEEVLAKVGSRLIQLLTETAYIQPPVAKFGEGLPDILPAFVHTHQAVEVNGTLKSNKRCGVIRCDPLILKGLEKTARHMVIPYMPMLVPPLKWTGYNKGAYLFLPSHVMRIRGSKQQRETMEKTSKQQLESVYEALDTLGRTKWRVNKRVLDVVERLWESGGGEAGLVDCNDVPLSEQPATEDEEEIKKWKREVRAVKKENTEKHGQRCDIELKLAVARKLKDEEGFYYPHNLDFRGRAYPMHPHLNHLGSDMCRGILEFAEGRPLGKSGLRWLKIHLANVYAGGVDKLPYEGREAFTENHREEIVDSANNPLGGKRWWLNAENPFQCLATCIALTEAWQSSSPETTISYIHVHQDGSCNGLQHYAALGRDKLGGAAVNLVGGEKPADVYSGIAARVHDIMWKDAEEDPVTFSDAVHARLLVNEVDRKLVKQTVMTSVYGVTFIGARDQIMKRLKERNVDDALLFPAACYAAKTTLLALEEMFESARSIMDWLGQCAQMIAGENMSVQWTTPLGLPVVQPYHHFGIHTVKTSLQALTLQRETDKVSAVKQKTAFPPNFVHSLDSTHMMMTALACKRAGLHFAGVHDSYWTHACDVDEMNRILREKFVELYEEPILENLLESFQNSYKDLNLKFPPLPERGDLDLRDVLHSPYFFN